MMAKKGVKKTKYRVCLFMPACLCALIAVVVTVGSYWVQIVDKYQEKEILAEKLVSLKETEEVLKVDVNRLEDPDYVARYAREKYNYSKDGEIILRLPNE